MEGKGVVPVYALTRRARFAFLAAGAFLAAAAWLLTRSLAEGTAAMGREEPVVVAARAIPAYTRLTPDLLTTIPVARRYRLPTYFTAPVELAGRQVAVAVLAGDVVTASLLLPATDLAVNERLLTLAAGERLLVEADLQPGDAADLIVAVADGGQPRAEVYPAAAVVVAVDRPAGRLPAVTLRLTLEAARRVVWAENFARQLRLVRRPPAAGTES